MPNDTAPPPPVIDSPRSMIIQQLAAGAKLERISAIAQSFGLNPCNESCLRWANRGRRGIKLPTVKNGKVRLTTRAAFLAWLEATSVDDVPARSPGIGVAEADQVLASFGLPRETA